MKTKICRLNIEINMDRDDFAVAASRIVGSEYGRLQGIAKAEYDEFLINIMEVMDACGFEILDEHQSDRVGSDSAYFTIYKKSESSETDIKCLVFIRISDHDMNEETNRQRKQYHEMLAEKYKQPRTKVKQRWKFRNIIVNNETFSSYDEALDDIERKLNLL